MDEYSTYLQSNYASDLAFCGQYIFSFGSNYALATRMFPADVREATIIFYSLLRYADELIDNPGVDFPGKSHNNLDEFIAEYQNVFKTGQTDSAHPIIRANYFLFQKYTIPKEYLDDFFAAMKQDATVTRYEIYKDLVGYMWGSATIVGHVMTYFTGFSDKVAFEHAQALAEGMQLANFLRDIDEDYQDRGRIYLPQQEMKLFGVTEEMIADRNFSPQLQNLIRHFVERTEKLFDAGEAGIRYLNKGRFPIRLASRIYRYNLTLLKKRNYNLFGSKIRVSRFRKMIILVKTIFG